MSSPLSKSVGRDVRYAGKLLWSVCAYSVLNRTMWPLIILLLLLSIAFLTLVTYTAAPFIYTVF
jgi:hypothetical protein